MKEKFIFLFHSLITIVINGMSIVHPLCNFSNLGIRLDRPPLFPVSIDFLQDTRFISQQGLLKPQLLRDLIKRKVVLSNVETVSYFELVVHWLSNKGGVFLHI